MITKGIKYFLVNQNRTYDIERSYNFLWAPISSERRIFHWENMRLVNENDIILNYHHGFIKSYCLAKSSAYDCDLPNVMHDYRKDWGTKGRYIDCEYHELKTPICTYTSEIQQEIISLSEYKYSPFNYKGNINEGYLYELNTGLAQFLIQKIKEANMNIEI